MEKSWITLCFVIKIMLTIKFTLLMLLPLPVIMIAWFVDVFLIILTFLDIIRGFKWKGFFIWKFLLRFSRNDARFSTQVHSLWTIGVRGPALFLSVLQSFVIERLSEPGAVCQGVTLKVGLDGIWQGELFNVVHIAIYVGDDAVAAQLV